jgi:hypothetical protein
MKWLVPFSWGFIISVNKGYIILQLIVLVELGGYIIQFCFRIQKGSYKTWVDAWYDIDNLKEN